MEYLESEAMHSKKSIPCAMFPKAVAFYLSIQGAVDSDLPANLLDNTIAPSHSAQTFAQVNAVAAVEMMAPGNKALGGHEADQNESLFCNSW